MSHPTKDWRERFDEKFPSHLTPICPIDGTPVPIENGWWVFLQGHDRKTLPQEIQDFILSEKEMSYREGRQSVIDEMQVEWTHEQDKMMDGFAHPKDCELCKLPNKE